MESRDSALTTAFSTIYSLVVGPDGLIYTYQGSDGHIRKYDSSGVFRGSVGRRGNGPSEFSSGPRALGFVDDTLWAWDMPDRVLLFLADGTFQRMLPVPALSGRRFVYRYMANDRLIVRDNLRSSSGTSDSVIYRIIDRDGTELQRIHTEVMDQDTTNIISVETGAGRLVRAQPLRGLVRTAFSATKPDFALLLPRRISGTVPGAVSGFLVRENGTSVALNLSLPRIAFTAADRDTLIEGLIERDGRRASAGFSAAAMRRGLGDQLKLPAFLDEVAEFRLCDEDCLWVRAPNQTSVWTILTKRGSALFQVRTPPNIEVFQVALDGFWGVSENEVRVPTILHYRVAGALPQR